MGKSVSPEISLFLLGIMTGTDEEKDDTETMNHFDNTLTRNYTKHINELEIPI